MGPGTNGTRVIEDKFEQKFNHKLRQDFEQPLEDTKETQDQQ